MINSPSKQVSKRFDSIIKNFEFSSLKKEFNFNFPSPSIKLFQSSNKKLFFEPENFNNNNDLNFLKGEKNIKQNLENEFENMKPKKETYPILFTVNDKFLDMLINIYNNTDNDNDNDIIISEYNNSIKENVSNEPENNLNNNIIKKNNYSESNVIDNNEQISCICLKSKCLNDYCRCHKNGSICNINCRCIDCKNKYKYIYSKDSKYSPNKKKLNNICKCKISSCLWNYCDCKKRGVLCSKGCLCSNCNNCENSNKK